MLNLYTDERVLRKRQFSECISQQAVNVSQEMGAKVVVDLGTGSGIVALMAARSLTEATVWATEVREEALELARYNAATNGIALKFAQGDWFTALPNDLRGRVDVAIATPPYLSSSEYVAQDAHVKARTPRLVMLGGETGLEPARAIASQGREWLRRGGCLLLECHPEMIPETAELLSQFGYQAEMNSWLGIVKAWNHRRDESSRA